MSKDDRDWINVGIDAETMALVEQHRERIRRESGLEVSRAAVVRALLRRALGEVNDGE